MLASRLSSELGCVQTTDCTLWSRAEQALGRMLLAEPTQGKALAPGQFLFIAHPREIK